jgi:hypothetical protein
MKQAAENIADLKQAARSRDAALRSSGAVQPGDLDRRNGFVASLDLSKARILAVGGHPFDGID